ncbi:g1174 [Coccomyxa elongata]
MEFGDRPPDPGLPQYKTIKTSLASVLKLQGKQPVIAEAACTINKIVIRALLFLRLYLIHHRDAPPVVNADFVDTVFKTVCLVKAVGRPPSTTKALRETLSEFYRQHFVPLLPADDQPLSYTYLSAVLDYASVQVVTAFENNIKMHFVEYVESYVNSVWEKDYLLQRIRATRKTKRERESSVRKLFATLRLLKTDLLDVGHEVFKSHHAYHDWIRQHRAVVLPGKTVFEKGLLKYDLQCKPQDYWPAMLRMTEALEQNGKRVRNFCPLRTSAVPRHITLDTTTLVHLLYTEEFGKKSRLLTKGELGRNKEMIWETFFRTNKRAFETRDYRFNHMVNTDGVSCSVLLIRRDLYGKKCSRGKPAVVASEEYVDDLSSDARKSLRIRKVVGIDPNMSDLLYCVDEYASHHYRYTQNQRRRETKAKKYREIVLKERNHTRIQGRTVTAFYEDRIYRKLRLNTFFNTRRSEQRLLQRFRENFGAPDEVVVGIGDWEQSKHRKYKEPTKGKGFRSLLRRAGYPVYLVDEFRTSCQCSHCQTEGAKCEKFRVRLDPHRNRAIEERRLRLVHGLLACKTCGRLWNRDVNSSINIARLTRQALETLGRPAYLSRQSLPPEADSAVASTA